MPLRTAADHPTTRSRNTPSAGGGMRHAVDRGGVLRAAGHGLRRAAALLTALLTAAALLIVPTPLGSPAVAAAAASTDTTHVATGQGDAIFVVYDEGDLGPVAVRVNGKFMNPGSNEGEPSAKLRTAANAALAAAGNKVHVIFGGREIATVPAKVADGNASITVPPALHLNEHVQALASPTLTGHAAASPRRAATPAERKAALALAAALLGHADPAKLDVRNLTAMDLGHGTALIATVFLNDAKTHQDHRLFLIAEPTDGKLGATLTNLRTMQHMIELANAGESIIDAIDLGDGTLSVVTREEGADGHTYAIYTRTKSTWKKAYEGGGVAL